MKKILILGSNGMVGKSVVNSFENSTHFQVIKSNRDDTDLFNFEETNKLISETNPDILVNAAAKVGGIVANNQQRTEFLIENLKININILESCIPFNNIKIINLGSSCIYPLNAKNPISETEFMNGKLEPTNSPYAMAKLTSIELGDAMNKQYGHEVINLMPTNLYGPNDNFSEVDSHVIPGLMFRMEKAKKENNPTFSIWGSGEPLREFLHVDDLSHAIKFIVENEINDNLINIGSGDEVSIKSIAETIKKVSDYKGNLSFDTTKPDGNPRKLLDSSKILKLGWKPEISLNDGLKTTYKWFKENIEII
jgi:GDP-L-fucose synthase|tara:strand:+ start:1435 stop:2361 length:927 start_codon:yes stop_codon:yes gene_type:complete